MLAQFLARIFAFRPRCKPDEIKRTIFYPNVVGLVFKIV